MTKYEGPLHPPDMEKTARKGYQVWCNQRERCSSRKHNSYKYYGAKGVEVRYSSRDFVAWYIHQRGLRKFKKPSVGRIDHSGHYEFGNIEMIERGDNTLEMLKRTGGNKVGITTALVFKDKTMAFCSVGKAAKHLGTRHSILQERMKYKPFAKPGNKPRKFDCEVMTLDNFLSWRAT